LTNANGDFTILGYEIPLTATVGTHTLRTTLFNDSATVASLDIGVTNDPFLLIDGDDTRIAGETVLVIVKQHAANTIYDMYVGGTLLRQVTTDVSGATAFNYAIPVTTPASTLTLTSRQGSTVVASTSLTVVEADKTYLPLIVR
ncbi:MAG: hypothetical protein ACE5H9_19675, partial [Anaerolineae bacterium]